MYNALSFIVACLITARALENIYSWDLISGEDKICGFRKIRDALIPGFQPSMVQQEGRAGRGRTAEAALGELRTHSSESNPWASVQKNETYFLSAHVWFGQLPWGHPFYARRREPQSSDMLALGTQNSPVLCYPPACMCQLFIQDWIF